MFHVQFLTLGSYGFLFCSRWEEWKFYIFVWNLQTVSPLKLIFSEGPSFLERSVCNLGALKKRLHVAALSSSLAMPWPAEITKNLNRSGLDSLVLVLQSSNSFILNAFFNFASVYYLLHAWVQVQFLLSGSCGSFVLFSIQRLDFFGFLVWNFATVPR